MVKDHRPCSQLTQLVQLHSSRFERFVDQSWKIAVETCKLQLQCPRDMHMTMAASRTATADSLPAQAYLDNLMWGQRHVGRSMFQSCSRHCWYTYDKQDLTK